MRQPDCARRYLTAALVALAAFIMLAGTMEDVGLTWDEPAYMASAQAYGEWLTVLGRQTARLQPWAAFSADTLQQYWSQPPLDLHPPLGKMAAAVSWRLLRDVVDPLTAFRLGSAALAAGLAGLVFLLTCELAGWAAGLIAAASLLAMPRFFFHSHLVALDVPVSFAWLLVVYVFWRRHKDEQARLLPSLLLGLAFGLALAVKNTSFLIAPALLAWALLFRRRRAVATLLVGMMVVGGLVFVISWPWLFADLPGRLAYYIERVTISHYDIPQYYLGQLHARPPWHYPFVVAAVVLPVGTLLLIVVGIVRAVLGGAARAGDRLVVINAVAPLVFFSLIAAQAYGGERLFMPAFPFLAILAGLGFSELAGRLGLSSSDEAGLSFARQRSAAARALGLSILAALAVVPGVAGIIAYQPHQLSYFNELVGGVAGADAAGFEVTYWSDTYRAALSFLNEQAEPNATIWTEEDGVLAAYQKAGLLRSDIQVGGRVVQAGPATADYALIQRRPSGYTPQMESIMREKHPVCTISQGGTPLAYIYKVK